MEVSRSPRPLKQPWQGDRPELGRLLHRGGHLLLGLPQQRGRAAISLATLRRISRVLPIRVVIEHGEIQLERRDARGRYTPVEPEATGKVPEEG